MSFFDDNEDEIVYGWGRDQDKYRAPPPRCKHCGGKDVRWRQQSGKWVLFSLQPGVVHACPSKTASPDEFPTI